MRKLAEMGLYATYYDDQEKSEVELLLDLWSKYEKRANPQRQYGRERLVDKPMPNNAPGRTLAIMIEITQPGDSIEQDEKLKENMLEERISKILNE